jgi:hypothetical protein
MNKKEEEKQKEMELYLIDGALNKANKKTIWRRNFYC